MADEPRNDEELHELRAEVARLRAERGSAEGDEGDGVPAPRRERTGWWRGVVVTVCLVLLGILAPLSIVATWAHDEVSDTDRYVDTVAPLIEDPAVQDAISRRITDEIVDRIDIEGITTDAVNALADQGLPPAAASGLLALTTPLVNGVESFIYDRVRQLVGTDEFAEAWREANREAHGQMIAVLKGDTDGAVQIEGDAVQLNLAALIDAVKARLIDAGFTLVERLPTISAEFTLFESSDLAKAQRAFRLLDATARALPVLALVLLGVALFVTRRRRRTLMIAALVIAGSMLLLGAALNILRVRYLDAIPSDDIPRDTAAAIYDQLVWFIRLNLRALLVLAVAVAAVAWVSGPEANPTAVRRGVGNAFDYVRSRRDRAGLATGPVGVFMARYRNPLRITVLTGVLLVYAMAEHPTGGWTIGLIIVAALLLMIVELLASAADEHPPAPSDATHV